MALGCVISRPEVRAQCVDAEFVRRVNKSAHELPPLLSRNLKALETREHGRGWG